MRRYRVYHILVVFLLLGCYCAVSFCHAESASDSSVDATLTCSFNSGAQVIVQAQMLVHSIDVFDTRYTREAIEQMASTNQYIMGAIMLRLHETVRSQIETAFSGADVDTMNSIPTYENPFFIDVFRVNLTSAFFKYNGSLNLSDFINGVLDMGATVAYSFDLSAEQGWNTTYAFELPSEMTLVYANSADTNPDTNLVRWVVRNEDGTDTGIDALISMQAKSPTTVASGQDDISLEFVFDARTATTINFIESVLVKRVNISRFTTIPAFVTGLGSIPADGVRLFIGNGLLSWTDLFANTIQPIEQQTTDIIANSSFQQNLSLSFQWDVETTLNCSTPYNITQMDASPAIQADFQDPDVDLRICQMPARALFGLIDAGANVSISSVDVNFGSGLEGLRYPYVIMLRLPANITLDGTSEYLWNDTHPIVGAFASGLQPNPPYTSEHVETVVVIELTKMDLNIPSVFTGRTELTASMKMREDDSLYVIRRPNELPFSSKVNLSYLNADAFRLCVEEQVFGKEEIATFLSGKTTAFQQRLSGVLHGVKVKGTADTNAFTSSLASWDGDISAMDDLVPVVVSDYANEVFMIGFNVSLWPASLSIVPQQFTFQGIENQLVTYRIIFPRGIEINVSENTGKTLITGTTNDGREYVELAFDQAAAGNATLLTCVMHASPVYILGLFLPCILVFLLLVVLIIIIFLIRKKRGGLRRGKHKLFEPEDNEPTDYSGQEYYVPPPPSSKKKR